MFGLNGSVLCDQQLPFVTIIEVRKPFYSVLQLKMRRDGGGLEEGVLPAMNGTPNSSAAC